MAARPPAARSTSGPRRSRRRRARQWACGSAGRGTGSCTGCDIGGGPTGDYRGVAGHHSGPPSRDRGSAQEGARDGHGEGCSGPIATCPPATCSNDATQGASHAANTTGTNPAQEDVRRSGAGDSSSHRRASLASGGGAPDAGGERRVQCGATSSTVPRLRPRRHGDDTNSPQCPAGIVASSAQEGAGGGTISRGCVGGGVRSPGGALGCTRDGFHCQCGPSRGGARD